MWILLFGEHEVSPGVFHIRSSFLLLEDYINGTVYEDVLLRGDGREGENWGGNSLRWRRIAV